MIKKWLERLPSRLPLTQLACTLVQTSCMQAEIDELRQENARLRDALTTARTALIEYGSAYLHHELRYQEALDAARAALGNKS